MGNLSTFDVIVIGGGPGGYVAAIRAAQLGLKTAIVEGHKLGGECLNYGCIPSKALISAGHLVDRIQNAGSLGISVKEMKVELPKLIEWKAGIVKQLTGGIAQLLKANGVKVFKGKGSFLPGSDGALKKIQVDPSKDSYDNGPGVSGEVQQIAASHVILATGSTTVEIPSFRFNGKTILSSKQALEVTQIPKKLLVIGGGFIGLEIGTFFKKLGSELTVVEATSTLLPGTDRDCVEVVQKKLQKKGAKILLGTKALGFEEGKKGGVAVQVETPSGQEKLDADWVLVTVGRRPRSSGLGLENIGLKTDGRGFLKVNAHLETEVPGVFAIGDLIGGPMLAHKASAEGLIAAAYIRDKKSQMDVRALPWAVFVDPEIAVVGHTEESARAAGWDPVVGKCPFVANGRALTTGEADGFVKILSDKKSGRLLGAHMVGPDVSNLISEVAAYLEMGASVHDIAKTIHAHPTLPETILEAAEATHHRAIHFFQRPPR